jgi:hypothetical protein
MTNIGGGYKMPLKFFYFETHFILIHRKIEQKVQGISIWPLPSYTQPLSTIKISTLVETNESALTQNSHTSPQFTLRFNLAIHFLGLDESILICNHQFVSKSCIV